MVGLAGLYVSKAPTWAFATQSIVQNCALSVARGVVSGSRNLPRSAAQWKFAQVLGGVAEELVHPRGRIRTPSGDVVPNVEAILMRFGRPNDLHASPAALRRRAAKPASTSSLEGRLCRPAPQGCRRG